MTSWDDTWEDDLDLTIKEGDQYLLFYLDEILFAMGSAAVAEIVEYPPITKVPMMNSSVLGVANIRGSIVGIIDLSLLLGMKATVVTPKTSVIIVHTQTNGEKIDIGLLVDEIFEVDNLHPDSILKCPPFGLSIDKKFIASMAMYKTSYLMLLDMDKVLDIEHLSEGTVLQ